MSLRATAMRLLICGASYFRKFCCLRLDEHSLILAVMYCSSQLNFYSLESATLALHSIFYLIIFVSRAISLSKQSHDLEAIYHPYLCIV